MRLPSSAPTALVVVTLAMALPLVVILLAGPFSADVRDYTGEVLKRLAQRFATVLRAHEA